MGDSWAFELCAMLIAMRRYPMFFIILLLSILMPLQAVAEVLLAPDPCPVKMVVDYSEEDYRMPCCPDEEAVPLCNLLKSCHLCKTYLQPLIVATPLPLATSVVTSSVKTDSLYRPINLFSIWRPPTQA
jgi:hypothetical protein